jgi:hypothetical protein
VCGLCYPIAAGFSGMIVAVATAPPNPLLHPIVFTTPRRLSPVTAWQEHTPFAMYLVDLLRPRSIVELGTHYGDSYCAFCQAVAELELPTVAYAVDTWTGDPQSEPYGEEVLEDLRAHHDPLYGGFSVLVRSTFDDALSRFDDGTVDLLHVDGCHTYEAARHDFDTWLPKVSPRGAVLLHDTTRRSNDFGVWRLLDELRERFPCLELTHSSGLALVLTGADPQEELLALTRLEGDELAGFRSLFATLGNRVRCIGEAQRRGGGADRDPDAAALERRVAALEERVGELYDSRLLRLGRRLRPG